MQPFLPLEALGRPIVILGPSNAGKSTLAAIIGRQLDLPVIHLDLFRHLPNTDWVPRSDEDFAALHDAAIAGDGWIMEGNYSALFPQRFARATGGIVLRSHHWLRFGRYLRRTLFEPHRVGNLEGGKDSLKWEMVHWIMVTTAKTPTRYRDLLAATGLPYVDCGSMRELDRLYAEWRLRR